MKRELSSIREEYVQRPKSVDFVNVREARLLYGFWHTFTLSCSEELLVQLHMHCFQWELPDSIAR